MYTVVKIPTKS